MGPAALRFFHSLARKNLTKNQGSGIITIPNRMTSESEASAMIQTIVDNGLPLEKFDQFIRSEDDILKYLNIIKNANKQRVIPADSPEGRQITEQLFGKKGEVVDMTGKKIDTRKGIMGGKSVEELMDSGQVTKGTSGITKSKKVQDREMFQAANERLTSDVDSIIKNIKSMEPITAMKEANSVIGRKGKYKNLTSEESKKILQDTEDHIFQRDPDNLYDPDPEDFAKGGRAGLKDGNPPVITIDDKIDEMISFYKDYLKKGGKMDFKTFSKQYVPENFASGGRAGFFMGSRPAVQKGLSTLREMLNYFGKKSDAVKKPSDILKIVNPKRLNQILEDPNIYRKFDVEKGIAAPDLIKNMQKQMMGDRQKTIEEMLGSAKNIKRADDNIIKYKNEMIEDMLKKGVDREMAEEMAETISKMAGNAAGKMDTPKLTDEGIMQLENILKDMETGGKTARELNATGGRIGYKDGPGMNRRTFLKFLGGLASLPIIGKIVKPLKTVKGVKSVPIIKTGDVPGKPEWFDSLVNKVIIEGDDVTKKFAVKDREVIHTKKLNDTDEVTVYQDLETDSIRVEYNSPENVFGETVDLRYTKSLPDEGAPKGSTDFEVIESGPVGKQTGPDDFDLDIDEVGGTSIKDLDSDVSKLKEYATGEKPTMKEFIQNKKRKDKAAAITNDIDGAASDAVTRRQGDYVPEYDDYASGGIARMLGE